MKQTASTLNGSYYNVLLREKWLRRFYRCDNSLKLKCRIKNREIPSDLLPKVPCPGNITIYKTINGKSCRLGDTEILYSDRTPKS